jgi:hypothetical protein
MSDSILFSEYLYQAPNYTYKFLDEILTVLGLGGMFGLLISASKLAAVFSFTSSFPRTVANRYDTPLLIGLFGLILQILGTMNLVPLFTFTGTQSDTIPNYILSFNGLKNH